jgi:glucan phosphoethanolaminetransferase (alkaline phosphatase superfamily)
MIQRIQSVYLSLIAFLSLLFFFGSFLSFSEKSGSVINVTFNGIVRVTSGQSPELVEKLLPLSGLIIIILIISLITVFLYKIRKIQMKLTIGLIVLSSLLIIALVHVSFSVIAKFDAHFLPGFKILLPVLMLIFSIMAYLGIRKDDQLVKSYDRLR